MDSRIVQSCLRKLLSTQGGAGGTPIGASTSFAGEGGRHILLAIMDSACHAIKLVSGPLTEKGCTAARRAHRFLQSHETSSALARVMPQEARSPEMGHQV